MKDKILFFLLALVVTGLCFQTKPLAAQSKLRALIIEGQNNHQGVAQNHENDEGLPGRNQSV